MQFLYLKKYINTVTNKFNFIKIETVLLCFIFFLALILRARYSTITDVWLDETTVYTLAATYSYRNLFFINHWDAAHPPLLYLFVKFLIDIFGIQQASIHSIRILQIFFSSLAVFPIYVIAKKLIKNATAFFVPVFYSVNIFQIYWGATMRPYGVLQFFLPVALVTFFKNSWNTKRKIILCNILFIFLFFWDYSTIWFFVTFYLYHLLAFGIRALFKKIYDTKIFLLSVLLWFPVFVKGFSQAINLEAYLNVSLLTLKFAIAEFYGVQTIFNANDFFYGIVIVLIISAIAFIVKKKKTMYFILIGIIVPIVTSFLYSIYLNPIFVPPNLIFSAILFLYFPLLFTPKKLIVAVVCVYLLFVMLSNTNALFTTSKFQSRKIIPHFDISKEMNTEQNKIAFISRESESELGAPIEYFLLQNGFIPAQDKNHHFSLKNKSYIVNVKKFWETTDSNIENLFFVTDRVEKPYSQEDLKKIITVCPLMEFVPVFEINQQTNPHIFKCK